MIESIASLKVSDYLDEHGLIMWIVESKNNDTILRFNTVRGLITTLFRLEIL